MPTWSSRLLPRPPSPSSHNHPSHTRPSHRTFDPERGAALAINYNVPILPSSAPPPSRPHRRSLSQPFPSLMPTSPKKGGGSGRKVTKEDFLDSDSDNGDDYNAKPYFPEPRSHSPRKGWTPADEVVNGKCMTCHSTMRWPRNTKVFRCTICLMVNDLEPRMNGDDHVGDESRPPTPPPKDGSFEPRLPATPLSIEKTKELIDGCLRDFLQRRLAETQGQEFESKYVHDAHLQQNHLGNPKEQHASSRNAQNEHNKKLLSPSSGGRNDQTTRLRSSSDTPVMQRNDPSPRGQDRSPRRINTEIAEPKHGSGSRSWIFRPLEDYIIKSLTGCDCLNNSFLTPGPPPRRTLSESIYPRPRPEISTPITSPDGQEFEFDPKMLLLGDIAENSSWWMGGRPQLHEAKDAGAAPAKPMSPRSTRSRVNSKSPRIDWEAVAEWYKVVVNVGESWREVWSTLVSTRSDNNQIKRELPVDMRGLDREIAEARVHAQRTLLKATENLLKQPRRPLRRLESARFLLIILANPQLTSRKEPVTQSLSPASANSDTNGSIPNFSRLPGTGDRRGVSSSHKSRPRGLVDHSGIVKRTLGLIANLPDSCHHYLVSWFARYSESQYERLVNLVGRFLTHRLTRQHGRQRSGPVAAVNGLVPTLPGNIENSHVQLHAALSGFPSDQNGEASNKWKIYTDDWQVRAAARVMALLFAANNVHVTRRRHDTAGNNEGSPFVRHKGRSTLPLNYFYNSLLDYSDLVSDFEAWEARNSAFSFCQYPFLLSISAKSRILEHDARRQMSIKAREAFLDSIFRQKDVSQYLNLKVRRDCLVEDSLRGVSEVVGGGQEEIKKSLRIEFVGEEGVDAGGLRKEWFLLLVREVFDPNHGLFVYDEDSQFCYFNPFCFESSEQFFLVGVLLGLAMYNSTILDVALPPFAFKKLLAAAPPANMAASSAPKQPHACTLDDLAEYRPTLAKGLQALLDYDGDVQETFCYDFVARVDRYGQHVETPLCPGGEKRPVTNSNRQQFVNLYVHYLLDTAVQRQFEPFKRGFFTVCGGNALSLFRPEEIELMVRGSDEPLDVPTLRAVATYENWPLKDPDEAEPVVIWFWQFFAQANPSDQRKLLSFVTGSDRIPATGPASLSIRLACLGDDDSDRYPIAHTCFNKLGLFRYSSKRKFEAKLWGAIFNSEGFGLK
ncbi:E3 ubiquitin-protein ligase HECTD2 [Talaromyces islandicus]|uniref:HECT-type E3 ubiquitin transferase n=1 Tax=Talaromyces islandicus TaxID=28573 RepID=A0A0U1M443_TALIS|nr:E3 ubiquitin-protein ligase HECTD2 [Talaromyces islandicus]